VRTRRLSPRARQRPSVPPATPAKPARASGYVPASRLLATTLLLTFSPPLLLLMFSSPLVFALPQALLRAARLGRSPSRLRFLHVKNSSAMGEVAVTSGGIWLVGLIASAIGIGAGVGIGFAAKSCDSCDASPASPSSHVAYVHDVALCMARLGDLRLQYVKNNGLLDIFDYINNHQDDLASPRAMIRVFLLPKNIGNLSYTTSGDVTTFALTTEFLGADVGKHYPDTEDVPPNFIHEDSSTFPTLAEAGWNAQYAMFMAQTQPDGFVWVNWDEHHTQTSVAKRMGPQYVEGHRQDYANMKIDGLGSLKDRVILAYCSFQEDGRFGPDASHTKEDAAYQPVYVHDFVGTR